MDRILFAWIGKTDLRASVDNVSDNLGPIAQVAKEGDFVRLVLLNNYGPEHDSEAYVSLVEAIHGGISRFGFGSPVESYRFLRYLCFRQGPGGVSDA